MEKVKLGDVCKVQGGYAFKSKEFQKDSIPIIRIGNIQDNEVEIDYNVCFTKEFLNKHPEFEIKYGDILIAMSGATVGKIGKYQNDTKALLNQRVGNFIVTEKLEKRYLYFLLQSPLFEKFILNNAFGCAQPNISSKQIEEFEFYNYDNVEQIEIANQLDKVQEIIDFRKKQIQELDELIKSQFVEMFGNPIFNDKNINLIEMPNVCEIIDGDRGKNYPKAEEFFKEEYCLFLNAKNVTTNGFSFENCMYITEEKDKKLRNGKLKRGDVVLTTRGTVGNLAFYTEEIPFENVRINSGMVILRMKKDIINEIFFIEQFKMQLDNIKSKIANGSAQPQLPITKMYGIKILLPNIELQNQFANIVKQIDKQKLEIQKSLEETQKLQESLMNKYFG